MSSYWVSARAVRGGDFTDDVDLGTTRFLKVPDGQQPKPSHAMPLTAWIKDLVGTFPAQKLPPWPRPVPAGDIVFFVHGYNNTIATVSQGRQLIGAGLTEQGFDCQVVAFDWPSGDVAIAYLRDLDHAKQTAIRLVNAAIRPFLKASSADCDVRIHVVGHSMGCFVLREAFDHADDPAPPQNWTIGQLVMFSGDVDAPSFAEGDADTESMYRHCQRFTNYFSGFDAVLQVSNAKRFGTEPRVGRVGLPADAPQRAVNVDCSAWFKNRYAATIGDLAQIGFTHSWWYADSTFMADLAYVLRGTIDREKIPTRAPGPGRTQILI